MDSSTAAAAAAMTTTGVSKRKRRDVVETDWESDDDVDSDARDRQHLIAIDIETSGVFMEVPHTEFETMSPNSLISIGMVVIRVDTGEVVESNRISLKEAIGHAFEPRCLKEFWKREEPAGSGKYPRMELLKVFQAEAVPAKEAMQAFLTWMQKQETTYATNMTVWGDCLAFDYTWLTIYLQRYLGHKGMLYGNGGTWRPPCCTKSYARGLTRWQGSSKDMWRVLETMIPDLPKQSLLNHDPIKDAQYIGQQAAAMLRYSAKHPIIPL